MKISKIMTQYPVVCTPDTPLEEVARMMVTHDCGAIPVVDNEQNLKPVGIITDRDIVCRAVAEGKNPLELKCADCMTRPVVTVNQDTSLEECLQIMEDNQIRRILVVDENGRCCGIVSQADIAEERPEEAAELVEAVSQPTDEPSGVSIH